LGVRAINVTRQTVLAGRVAVAVTFWDRLIGLIGRSRLDPDEALWISPCRSIHTLGMRFPIDAVFLNSGKTVVKTITGLRPFRICLGGRKAVSIIELPAGILAGTGTLPGDRIDLIEDA
jgi:uncharacterized protein